MMPMFRVAFVRRGTYLLQKTVISKKTDPLRITDRQTAYEPKWRPSRRYHRRQPQFSHTDSKYILITNCKMNAIAGRALRETGAALKQASGMEVSCDEADSCWISL